MSKRSEAVVAELRRLERNRRIATAVAFVTAFATMASLFVLHAWYARVAIVVVGGLVVLVCASIAQSALNPFTMEKATRPRRTGVFTAKAEAKVDKLDDLFERENVAAVTEEKRDES